MSFSQSVHAKAADLARLSIEMTAEAGSGHPTSAMSLAHIVTVLMYRHMRYDPSEPGRTDTDRLVLSEGHACPIIYAAAADLGMTIGKPGRSDRSMDREDALSLRALDSEIDGHPNPAEGFPFFPAATGSLGQGLSVAAGLALSSRLDGLDSRHFAIIGDGESREGQVWEAMDFLADHSLTSVCPIFNCNGYGQTGAVSPQQSPERLAARIEAAGLQARVIDGHEPGEILAALEAHAANATGRGKPPLAIVARTVKGWGSATARTGNRHGKPLTGEDKSKVLSELETTAAGLGAAPGSPELSLPSAPPAREPGAAEPKPMPGFQEALERFGMEEALAKGEMATRKAYGVALRALGLADPRVVVLDGDVSNSTHAEQFKKEDELKPRFFECRIAEQHMVSCAGGLAGTGKIPFASSFGKFIMRACDQLEMALVGRSNVKVVGSHTGVSLAADGPSQMALTDMAFFRSFTTVRTRDGEPLLYLLQPADAVAAYGLTRAMAEHDGACYMRTHRPAVPIIYDDPWTFRPGGHQVVEKGKDVLLVSAGYMLHETVRASRTLRKLRLEPTVVDLYSIPFDHQALAGLARENEGRVVTVEDNYGAGLGSAVADCLAEMEPACQVRQLHVRKVPKSGRTPERVLEDLSLSADHISEAAAALATRVDAAEGSLSGPRL